MKISLVAYLHKKIQKKLDISGLLYKLMEEGVFDDTLIIHALMVSWIIALRKF